eukprot:COSAG01_NODE_25313_length_749_cov_1.092308_2_plen_64_part_01
MVKITDFGLSKDKDTQSQALGGTKTMLMTGCEPAVSVLGSGPSCLRFTYVTPGLGKKYPFPSYT